MTAIGNANTIEELLILNWHFNKVFDNYFSHSIYTLLAENLERISYNNALFNATLIIEDLINGYSLKQIMDNYNTTRQSIKKIVINYLERDNYNDEILDIIPKLDEFIIPEHDREFLMAKVAVKMFVENNCFSAPLIYKKFECLQGITYKYLNILETSNHPLYKQYIKGRDENIRKASSMVSREIHRKDNEAKKNKISYVGNLDSKEVLDILSNPYKEEFKNFCMYYNFDDDILKQMLIDDENLKYLFTGKDNNIESIKETYNRQIISYKELIRAVIRKIIILSKDKFKKTLDLYDYYTTTKFDFKSLARLALSFNDIKNNGLILQYIDKFPDVFKNYNDYKINSLKQIKIMSCCNDSIRFTNEDLTKALEDINEKDLPKENAVLYYAIKRQVVLRDIKVKRK